MAWFLGATPIFIFVADFTAQNFNIRVWSSGIHFFIFFRHADFSELQEGNTCIGWAATGPFIPSLCRSALDVAVLYWPAYRTWSMLSESSHLVKCYRVCCANGQLRAFSTKMRTYLLLPLHQSGSRLRVNSQSQRDALAALRFLFVVLPASKKRMFCFEKNCSSLSMPRSYWLSLASYAEGTGESYRGHLITNSTCRSYHYRRD